MYKGQESRAFDGLVPVKSKFEADIIRFSLCIVETCTYDEFRAFLAKQHDFDLDFEFTIYYTDHTDNDLLPISNDGDFTKALFTTQNLLRLFLQRKGEESNYFYALPKKRSKSKYLWRMSKSKIIAKSPSFRQMSKMVDIDFLKPIVRVRFMKNKSNKPLGLCIKEGQSYRVLPLSPDGVVEQVPGVFISRLVSGGLAESTGLLAINDEVLEVNGIEVLGKTLDQVYDMMLANLSNLVITIRPAKQHAKKPLVDEKSLNDPQFCYCRLPDFSEGLERNITVEENGRVIIESWV